MAPSTPQGLLAGSKREHPFHLLGIHTQQSLTNWHFILWPIWSPLLAILVPHQYCGEPPCTHSLHSSSQLDTHKVLVHRKYEHKSPHCGEPPRTHSLPLCFQHKSSNTQSSRAALWQVFIGSGAAYSFASSANQLQALYLLYLGFQPLTNLDWTFTVAEIPKCK